jgi:hypothetical protein
MSSKFFIAVSLSRRGRITEPHHTGPRLRGQPAPNFSAATNQSYIALHKKSSPSHLRRNIGHFWPENRLTLWQSASPSVRPLRPGGGTAGAFGTGVRLESVNNAEGILNFAFFGRSLSDAKG